MTSGKQLRVFGAGCVVSQFFLCFLLFPSIPLVQGTAQPNGTAAAPPRSDHAHGVPVSSLQNDDQQPQQQSPLLSDPLTPAASVQPQGSFHFVPEQEKVKAFYEFLLHGKRSGRDFVESVRGVVKGLDEGDVQVVHCWGDDFIDYQVGEGRPSKCWTRRDKRDDMLEKASAVLRRDKRAGGQLSSTELVMRCSPTAMQSAHDTERTQHDVMCFLQGVSYNMCRQHIVLVRRTID